MANPYTSRTDESTAVSYPGGSGTSSQNLNSVFGKRKVCNGLYVSPDPGAGVAGEVYLEYRDAGTTSYASYRVTSKLNADALTMFEHPFAVRHGLFGGEWELFLVVNNGTLSAGVYYATVLMGSQ